MHFGCGNEKLSLLKTLKSVILTQQLFYRSSELNTLLLRLLTFSITTYLDCRPVKCSVKGDKSQLLSLWMLL